MSKLLSYLRAWGKSITYTNNSARTEMATENTSAIQTFVMPFDGIVMIEGRAGASGAFNCHIWGTGDPPTTSIDSSAGSPFSVRSLGRFKKGNEVRYVLHGFNELNVYAYRLGGGINRLITQVVRYVRGGGLCLRHFSNHCSRFLLKSLKLRGLAHKRFHDQATEFRWSVHNTEHILRQMMAILAFMSHRKAHLICTQPGTELVLHHVLHQVINTRHRGQLQFERATLSTGCVIKSRMSYGSFLPKVDNSLIATEVCHG